MTDALTIRSARPADAAALADLAALDSTSVPQGDLLVAEVGGHLLAALSLADGRAIADPFMPTAHTVHVLRVRAQQLRAPARAFVPAGRRLRARAASG